MTSRSSSRKTAHHLLVPLLVAALATGLTVPRAEACHLPEQAEYLSAQQASLAVHSHGDASFIAYSLEQSTACVNGMADIFPCENVDLLAHLPLSEIGGGSGNDIWGWRDPSSGKEYAIIGRTNGVAFVDMSDPENPVYLGNLPTHAGTAAWRDIKVYKNHAYVVADFAGEHGMQVFDLTQLRGLSGGAREFSSTAHYDHFDRAHNVVINEESGFAYAVGSETCSGGLHMIDIRTPKSPQFAGCFDEDGYTHDAQCVIYRGPDSDYRGREICFAANENTVTVVDVTDKSDPVMLSRNRYTRFGYTHQGWLTEDHAYFVVDDELDEQRWNHNTKTYTWDLKDLTEPVLAGEHISKKASIDHNQYIVGNHTYQANYQKGLTISELTNLKKGKLTEVGFFDTYPEGNRTGFSGAWSVYPFLSSGAVIISDINRGLFIVRPRIAASLFSDDFEAGSLSAWSNSKGPGVAVVSPGLKKSDFALGVSVDGTETVSQLAALQPAREESLKVSFTIKPNGVDLGGQAVEILRLVDPRKKTIASLMLERRGAKFHAELWAESDGELELIGSTPLPSKAIALTIEWQQASGNNAGDGEVRLIKKKKTKVERLTLDTTRVVDAVRLGLPAGSAGTANGQFLIDEFSIRQ
jgi:choice-of-anchor B domain-containing protein